MLGHVRPMFGTFKKNPVQLAAFETIERWTRVRFALADSDAVLVTEITCRLPGCPPLETVIAFWSGDTRHHIKIFKKAIDVVEDDLPPRWYKPALVVDDSATMECAC